MKIKEICEKTGLTDRTIRYYIEEQLIAPYYTENYLGRKSFDFSENDLERLKNIATLRAFGFSVEEIKEISSGAGESQQIVEAVKRRTGESLDESRRRLNVLSSIDNSDDIDLSRLAQKLSSYEPTIENEPRRPNFKKRFIAFLSSCVIFLAVWLPIILTSIVLVLRISTTDSPIVRPVFFVITLLCFLPSTVTMLVLQRLKGARRVLRIILIILCVLCIPVGAFFSSNSIIACEHHYELYRATLEPTCLSDGENVMKCGMCGGFETRKVEKLPHSVEIIHGVEPTCNSTGLSDGSFCSFCNELLVEQSVLPITDIHTAVTDAAIPATCKSTGLSEGSHCSRCNVILKEQKIIPISDEHTPIVEAALPATCNSIGLTEGSRCLLCDKILIEQKVIPITDTHISVKDASVPATCTQSGLSEGSHCSHCKKILKEQTVIPAKGHSYTVEIYPATCGFGGGKVHRCACGDAYKTDLEEPTNEHIFEENSSGSGYICKTCSLKVLSHGNVDGSSQDSENQIKYYITNSWPETLVIYGNGDMPDFESYDGPAWISQDMYKVKTIIIESGVKSVGDLAFSGSYYDSVRQFIIRSKDIKYSDRDLNFAGINTIFCKIVYDY